MFWSQFILAKQGPLGTIWIAAHSVNASKLRKSQIAETDLAESCDTIIHQTFNHQKVPLALRLSGQLLLGVVRIYNRKLDFLHRDSAEALVKIRQAFHPGASVDLPPDALTAPLASITQPELDYDSLDFYADPASSYQLQLEPLASREHIDLGDPFLGDLAAYAGEEEFEYGVLPEDEDVLMESDEPETFRALSPGSARRRSGGAADAAVPAVDEYAALPLPLDDEEHFVAMPEDYDDAAGVGSAPVDGARGGSLAGSLDLDAPLPTPGDSVGAPGGTPAPHSGGLAATPAGAAAQAARERAAAPSAEKARKRKFKLDAAVVLSNAQIRAALADVSDIVRRRAGLPHARTGGTAPSLPRSLDELLAAPAIVAAEACPRLRALFEREAATGAPRRAAGAAAAAAAQGGSGLSSAGFAAADLPTFEDDFMPMPEEDEGGWAGAPVAPPARSEGAGRADSAPFGGSLGGPARLGSALDAGDDGDEADGDARGQGAQAEAGAEAEPQAGPHAWSKRTRHVLSFLQRSFAAAAAQAGEHTQEVDAPAQAEQAATPAPAAPQLALEPLLAGESKGHAARLFFELLVLQTGGFVALEQAAPYGDIAIAQTHKLLEATAAH